MKKQGFIRACLVIAYCVPFSFLCVNGDASSGTMVYYGVMIAGFALLCWAALRTDNVAVLYIGNGLSLASSYAVAKLTGLDLMGYYFKPFTAYSLIVIISAAAFVVQTIAVLSYARRKRITDQM